MNILYNIFGEEEINECVPKITDSTILHAYITQENKDPALLNKIMTEKYIENYNLYLDYYIYDQCFDKAIDFYGLYDYLPLETRKLILSNVFEEKTNLQVYSESKKALNAYLNTLGRIEKNRIKDSIKNDMQTWYPSHHEELNNYYRTLIGLPPLNENGEVIFNIDPDASKKIKQGATYSCAMLVNATSYNEPSEYVKLTESGKVRLEFGTYDLALAVPEEPQSSFREVLAARIEPTSEESSCSTKGTIIDFAIEESTDIT